MPEDKQQEINIMLNSLEDEEAIVVKKKLIKIYQRVVGYAQITNKEWQSEILDKKHTFDTYKESPVKLALFLDKLPKFADKIIHLVSTHFREKIDDRIKDTIMDAFFDDAYALIEKAKKKLEKKFNIFDDYRIQHAAFAFEGLTRKEIASYYKKGKKSRKEK